MTDQANAYETVLADLRAKRAELDSAIAAIERIMASSGRAHGATQSGAPREGSFFGMSLTEAAKNYLQMVRKKQSAREIAEALEAGGFIHSSKDFPNTVRAIIARNAANEGDFVRLQGEWGLAEWSPGAARRRTARRNAEEVSTLDSENVDGSTDSASPTVLDDLD